MRLLRCRLPTLCDAVVVCPNRCFKHNIHHQLGDLSAWRLAVLMIRKQEPKTLYSPGRCYSVWQIGRGSGGGAQLEESPPYKLPGHKAFKTYNNVVFPRKKTNVIAYTADKWIRRPLHLLAAKGQFPFLSFLRSAFNARFY